MPRPYNYHKAKREAASARGRMMPKARWKKRELELAANPPILSVADRLAEFLRRRRGIIAEIHDVAMTPECFPIQRYD